jgi:hypothetical protein
MQLAKEGAVAAWGEADRPRVRAGRPHLAVGRGGPPCGVLWCLLECPCMAVTW